LLSFVLHNPKLREEILHVAERIISALLQPIELSGEMLTIGSSLGISIFPDDGVTSADLIRKADKAMYAAKDSDKNPIYFFTAEFDQAESAPFLASQSATKLP